VAQKALNNTRKTYSKKNVIFPAKNKTTARLKFIKGKQQHVAIGTIDINVKELGRKKPLCLKAG
jgi:hypothetical protein